MKFQLIIWIFCLATNANTQSSQIIKTEIVKFRTASGDLLQVTARPLKVNSDTVQLIIEYLTNEKPKEIQRLTMLFSFPLTISLIDFNDSRGITIQYDPAARWGNSFLYLFDEKIKKLRKVPGFEKLGDIQSFTVNKKKHTYSYISCGCADNCWTSVLFKIKNFKIDTLGYLHCDCYNLIEKTPHEKDIISKTCSEFNDDQKFGNIRRYWINRSKKGL